MTPKKQESALKDKDWCIRMSAVELGGLTPAQQERY